MLCCVLKMKYCFRGHFISKTIFNCENYEVSLYYFVTKQNALINYNNDLY